MLEEVVAAPQSIEFGDNIIIDSYRIPLRDFERLFESNYSIVK